MRPGRYCIRLSRFLTSSVAAGSPAWHKSARPATGGDYCGRSPSPPEYGRGVPGCGLSVALSPGLIRLRSRARRPGPPPSVIVGQFASFQEAMGGLIPLGGLPRRDLHAPPKPVQQQIHPGHGVAGPNRRRMTSAMRADVQHWSSSPMPPGRLPAPFPVRAAALGSACTGHRRRRWRPAQPGHRRPARGATGSPTSATRGNAGPPPGR